MPAVTRLAFRLVVVFALALLWPGPSPQRAAGLVCVFVAVGCLVAALRLGEKPVGGFNR